MSGVASPPTWRVYVTEWVTVYTSDGTDEAGAAETRAWLEATYAGRVQIEDLGLVLLTTKQDDDLSSPVQVSGQVRKPNLRGEWKYREDADDHAARIRAAEDVTPAVAGAGTQEEQALLDYGKRMLPA
jgi:hypothetical protein